MSLISMLFVTSSEDRQRLFLLYHLSILPRRSYRLPRKPLMSDDRWKPRKDVEMEIRTGGCSEVDSSSGVTVPVF